MPDFFASLIHEFADSGFHSPMFLHSYSANCNKRMTTPYGMITLICYFGSCTLAAHSLQKELYAPVMFSCCVRITLPGLESCTDHGQHCFRSWSNLLGRKKHSWYRWSLSGKKLLPKKVQYVYFWYNRRGSASSCSILNLATLYLLNVALILWVNKKHRVNTCYSTIQTPPIQFNKMVWKPPIVSAPSFAFPCTDHISPILFISLDFPPPQNKTRGNG